jgi:outer membrane biosynthesis protein TonB
LDDNGLVSAADGPVRATLGGVAIFGGRDIVCRDPVMNALGASRIAWALLAASALAIPASAASPGVRLPRVIQTVEPRFPDELARRAIYDGQTRIVLLIDAEGRLADWLLLGYSHPLLAREATEALRVWRFEPARLNNEPVEARLELSMQFQAGGMIVSLTEADLIDRFQLKTDQGANRLAPARELDVPLAPVRTVMPLWPGSWQTDAKEGRVVLDFYVDDEGRPRMPVVREADHDALVPPAIEALSHWRFAAPTRRGAPVVVKAVQSFRFQRK